MRVFHPEAFYLFFLLIPIAAVAVTGFVNGMRDLELLCGKWQKENLFNLYLVKWFFSSLFFLLAFSFGVLAYADFSWGQRPVEETRSGIDFSFLVDTSRSMLARDLQPTRLGRSGEIVRGIMNEFPDSRFSVVLFKGQAVQVIPLTEDSSAVETLIGSLSTDFITTPGTDLESGMEAAIASFPRKMNRNRAVILFTDGGYLSGSPFAAARKAGDLGVPFFVLGAGTEAGSTIELSDGSVLTDEHGKPVVSALKAGPLEEIAALSGGRYLGLSEPQALGSLLRTLHEHDGKAERTGFRLELVHRYRLFLLLSFFCFLAYIGIRVVKWRKTF